MRKVLIFPVEHTIFAMLCFISAFCDIMLHKDIDETFANIPWKLEMIYLDKLSIEDDCILFSIYFYLVSGVFERKNFFLFCHSNMSVNLSSCDRTVSQ